MIIGGRNIGSAKIQNVVLEPGNNTLPARGILDLKAILRQLPQIISSESGALKNGNIEISASGNSTVYNGEHLVYYEQSLNQLILSTQIPLLSLLKGSLQGIPGPSSATNTSSVSNISSVLTSIIKYSIPMSE